MDLILWRHAEAEELPETITDAQADLARKLTPRGEKQAARMADWLDRQLAGSTRIVSSPARRWDASSRSAMNWHPAQRPPNCWNWCNGR